MEHEQRQSLKKYLDIALRRKKFIIFCLLVCIVAGLGQYLRTPKSYLATSLIRYQRQSVNPSKMSPDVQTRIREMVSTVGQQITSRTSLERLIKKFDLYTKMREKMPMEDVVVMMRDHHINIKPEGRGDIFRVSYHGGDPKKVMLVTNELAAKFIEENLRFREERASETSAYVKDELQMAKKSLDKIETTMRDYKLKFYNEMPQQRDVNMSRLNSLQTQYQGNQDSIQDLERTKILIQEQISLRKKEISGERQRMLSLMESTGSVPGPGQGGGYELEELSGVRRALKALQIKYTELHPDVRRLKRTIKELEESLAAKSDSGPESEEVVDTFGSDAVIENQFGQMILQQKGVEYNIERLKKEKEEIRSQIEKYQKWVEAAPVREAEWTALTRDYEQLNRHYQELVARNLAAESAESLERRQKGSQFKIVDPAHFPEKPFKPDFIRIMLVALAIGFGMGGGLSFGLEFLDTSFKDAEELEPYLKLPVVCSIPYIFTEKEKKWNKTKFVLWAAAFVVSVGIIIAGTAYMIYTGRIIL
ncbi:MAG: hypothetical protein KAJ45_01840 [Desulfobulbaceae bacterium]|nr:hypothetical protein [Desulfobulbaceae bacterium]